MLEEELVTPQILAEVWGQGTRESPTDSLISRAGRKRRKITIQRRLKGTSHEQLETTEKSIPRGWVNNVGHVLLMK